MTKLLPAVALALLLAAGILPAQQPLRYEAEFRSLCGRDWSKRWAQAKVESGLNPKAISPVGAKGLMQAMDPTFGDYRRAGWVGPTDSPYDVLPAINGGHHYMLGLEARFRDQWAAWAAFNWGGTRVDRARRAAAAKGQSGRAWLLMAPKETQAYPPRIEAAWRLTEGRPDGYRSGGSL